LSRRFLLGNDHLPRQTPDNHKRKLQTKEALCVFSSVGAEPLGSTFTIRSEYEEPALSLQAVIAGKRNAVFAPFDTKNDRFTKTGSGQA